MRTYIEAFMGALAESLRHALPHARRHPRRARGTYVPVTIEAPAMRLAH